MPADRRSVRFSTSAEQDIRLACRWLDDINHSLGNAFLQELNRLASRIDENPELYQRFRADCRRAVLRAFDYALVYRVEHDQIQVIGVLHTRLDPNRMASRVKAASE